MDSTCSARVPSYAVAVNRTRKSVVASVLADRARSRQKFVSLRSRRPSGPRGFSIRAQQRASPSTRPVSDEHVLRASTRRPKRTSKPPSSCFQTHAAAFMGSRYIPSTWAARRGQQNWLHDIRNVGIVCCGGRRLLRFGAERGTEQEQFVARRCSASAAIGRLPHECAMRARAEATCSHTAFDA